VKGRIGDEEREERVFLVDDHEIVRRRISDLLEGRGDLEWSVMPPRLAVGDAHDPAVMRRM